jgi:hypothetical protein
VLLADERCRHSKNKTRQGEVWCGALCRTLCATVAVGQLLLPLNGMVTSPEGSCQPVNEAGLAAQGAGWA